MSESPHSILKIYASTTDKFGSKLLYEYLVNKAKDEGISGVTVHRGIMGYGKSSKISTSRFWELTEKLPVIIEMVDASSKLMAFYQKIEDTLKITPKGILATIEPIEILLQKSGKK